MCAQEMDWFSRSPTKPGEHMTVETLMEFIVFQEPGDDDEGSDPWVDLGDGVKIFMVSDPVTNEITYVPYVTGGGVRLFPSSLVCLGAHAHMALCVYTGIALSKTAPSLPQCRT